MTKKTDHVASHDDDDLPPIRSGEVSMKKPTVSGRWLANFECSKNDSE